MLMKPYLIVCCSAALLLSATPSSSHAERQKSKPSARQEILVDAIVASVDGNPITLRDVQKRLSPPRQLTVKEASLDPEANAALDALIMEALIVQEAEVRRISVSDEEIDRYIEEVAKRNNLSREGFEKALTQEGKNLTQYKTFVKVDILRSRLASSIMQSGAGVTEQDIDTYIDEHPELRKGGNKVKLAHILISESGRGEDGMSKRVQEVQEKIASGEEFDDLAREYSDSPNAEDGGSLGIIATRDLSSEIFEGISGLQEGEVSKPVRTSQGTQFFQVVEQYADSDNEEESKKLRAEVRERLQRQKLEQKMTSFFTAELMKNHAVDRKM